VGRFVAAVGPAMLGYLRSNVFGDYAEPMRPAAMVMCSVFVVGMLTVPFAPETKDQPLPE
jgi:cyanate permease